MTERPLSIEYPAMAGRSVPGFRITCIAPNQIPMDWEGNLNRILSALTEIQKKPEALLPQLILLPELSLSGYSCEDAFFADRTFELALKQAQRLAIEANRLLPGVLLFCGLPFLDGDLNYNCMAALLGGRIVGLHPKSHLANEGLHYEARYFRAWSGGVKKIYLDSTEIPFGVPIYEFGGLRIGLEICRDSWVADRPLLKAKALGLDLILNPSASHFAFGKYDLRRHIAIESSRQFFCHFVQVNLLGNEAGPAIFDGSTLLAAGGKLLYENSGMGYSDFHWQSFAINVNPLRIARRRSAPARPYASEEKQFGDKDNARPILYQLTSEPAQKLGFSDSPAQKKTKPQQAESSFEKLPGKKPLPSILSPLAPLLCKEEGEVFRAIHNGRYRKFDEFLRSTTLGLFDYLRKSRARGFVVSLSGGADSALSALLIERMIGFGIHLLGAEAFLKRIGQGVLLDKLQSSFSKQAQILKKIGLKRDKLKPLQSAIVQEILFTVYQKTEQSSKTTQQAASHIAKALNSRHSEADIESLIQGYRKLAESALGRSLSWETDDLVLQNIQARVRAPLAWMLANATGSLLISTGNRSEAAVGYLTMDGDTAGGLAPIAGVSKTFILEFLAFMEKEGDSVCGPMPALSLINSQSPTAELRPQSFAQTDESDLMPYPILEAIETQAIKELKSPSQILNDLLEQGFSVYSEEDLQLWIEKFFQLWTKNQWKRERLAPSFHLDTHSIDPRGYFRFPVLSRGFGTEAETK